MGARPVTCPRCSGTILSDAMGDRACLQCGYEYISPAQQASTQRELARIEALKDSLRRHRDPSTQGMQL